MVFNPAAGRHRRDALLARALLSQAARDVLVRETETPSQLHDALVDFRDAGVSAVALSGGDGTAGRVASAMERVYGAQLPPMLLLRGGTMNTTANAVGVSRRAPGELLSRLVARARAGRPLVTTPRGTMRVGDRLGFLFGVGVVAGYLRAYYAAGARGPVSGAEVLVRGVASALVRGAYIEAMAERVRCAVSFDAGAVSWPVREYLSIAAGTIDQIGLGFRPFARAAEDPARFHLLGIHTTPLGFARELPRIWAARAMHPTRADERLSDRASLRFAREGVGYMLDGDLETAPGDTLVVQSGPVISMVVV